MKKLMCLVFLWALTVSVSSAEEYPGYDPRKVFTPQESAAGIKSMKIDMRYLDQMLGDLERHAGSYPVSFDSDQQKMRASQELMLLSEMLDYLVEHVNPGSKFLLRAAMANRMGHNLDIPGSASKAEQQFRKLLDVEPKNPEGNYQFGVFLAGSGKSMESIAYLQRARELGLVKAEFSLGLAYITSGDKAKSIDSLSSYIKQIPTDTSAQELLQAINDGKLKINKI